MSQNSITKFFKPVNRTSQLVNELQCPKSELFSEKPLSKKLKLSPDKENFTSENELKTEKNAKQGSALLAPEQKSKMETNGLKAQLKMTTKKCAALHENMGLGWFNALKPEFSKTYFEKLSAFQTEQRSSHTIFPPHHEVYSWSNYCDIGDVNVVILGQDPYHGTGQAHGLCFSVPKGIPPPPSLVNMYKELENDIPGFKRPGHGFLAGWAKQGVLLLNACLTVRAHNANSHKDKGWESFTDAVIKAVSSHNEGVVFLLWGSYAQKKAAVVDKKKHHLLHSTHPSPLSAYRGFFGCRHFSKCNDLLIQKGRKPIDWGHLPLDDD